MQQEPEKPTKLAVSSDGPPISITTEDPPIITSTNVPVPEVKENYLEKYLPRNGAAMSFTSDNQASRPDPETAKKRQNVLTRILWTFIMIGGFIGNYPWTKFSQIYPTHIFLYRFTASWTCLLDSFGYVMSNISLPGGNRTFLSENCSARVS